jgi:outer membrane murein-binding lipoprotein Lpp
MGFLDKAKSAAEQAAARAKEGVEDVQIKRELGQAYGELGRTAFELIESGGISHPSLEPLAAKVRSLNERAADEEPVGAAAPEAQDSNQPPAMPS